MKTVFLDFDSLHPGDLDLSALQAELTELVTYPTTAPDQVRERLQDAEVVIVNKVRLDADTLAGAAALRLICLAATGADNVDLEAAAARGVAVANIRDYCTPSVVQHVFALLLTLNQQLDSYRAQVRAGAWQNSPQFCLLEPPLAELHDKTLGLLGCGTLGQGVARVAQAFGMRVVAAQLPGRAAGTAVSAPELSAPVERQPLETLLATADCVSLHCPLNDHTQGIIGTAALRTMQRHALLINTARGGLVDSAALVAALRAGEIAGAAIDVLQTEPPVSDPLLNTQLPNLIVTPHMAWSARESRQRAVDQILENIQDFRHGRQGRRIA